MRTSFTAGATGGDSSASRPRPIPESYAPKPFSKNFVRNLDYWYAQSHPDEDFAETFAVWLDPTSSWRERYKGWPALRKLEYMDKLMHETADEPLPLKTRRRPFALSGLKQTLRSHYEKKREMYQVELPTFYDRDLKRLFDGTPARGRGDRGRVHLPEPAGSAPPGRPLDGECSNTPWTRSSPR